MTLPIYTKAYCCLLAIAISWILIISSKRQQLFKNLLHKKSILAYCQLNVIAVDTREEKRCVSKRPQPTQDKQINYNVDR